MLYCYFCAFPQNMDTDLRKWIYLLLLSIVWGSSFILIKKGLDGLTPIQLGCCRIIFATVALFVWGWNRLGTIRKHEWKWIILSSLLGTFFPTFLFAYAEMEIGSAISSILNCTTPLLTIIFGIFIFKIRVRPVQIIGVCIGLVGSLFLILSGAAVDTGQNYWYAGLVILATFGYAGNVNVIKAHMQHINPLAIMVGSFAAICIPALLILLCTDFFSAGRLKDPVVQTSLGYVALLAIFGTALAKVWFNTLVQISDTVFASSVTYTIPIIALFWGILDGEYFGVWQGLSSLLILTGVFLVNYQKRKTARLKTQV